MRNRLNIHFIKNADNISSLKGRVVHKIVEGKEVIKCLRFMMWL